MTSRQTSFISIANNSCWSTHLTLIQFGQDFLAQLFRTVTFNSLQVIELDTTNALLRDLLYLLPAGIPLVKITEKKRRYYLTHLIRSLPAYKFPRVLLRIQTLLNFSNERFLFFPPQEQAGPFEAQRNIQVSNYDGQRMEIEPVKISQQERGKTNYNITQV